MLRDINIYFYAIPLIIAVSLVYAASRHESFRRIWPHAARLATLLLGILVFTTALLLVINTQV